MYRGHIRSKARGGVKPQLEAMQALKIPKNAIYIDDRDDMIRSLRVGDGAAVLRLSCLATSKPDLRWALIGEDKKTGYKGVFLRKAFVFDIELGAELRNMKEVEAVLRATEDWAKERSTVSPSKSKEYGKLGGRPKKTRTDKHTAYIAWRDLVTYPTQEAALASEHMRGWSKSAATRAVKLGGLGPRGAIPGRLPKQKSG